MHKNQIAFKKESMEKASHTHTHTEAIKLKEKAKLLKCLLKALSQITPEVSWSCLSFCQIGTGHDSNPMDTAKKVTVLQLREADKCSWYECSYGQSLKRNQIIS